MRYKKVILISLLLGLGLIGQAQETVPASGGHASGDEGSVNYTVGQIFYNFQTGTNGSIIQGVQQPYEISVVSGIEEAKGINLEIATYPNPTTDFLILKVENLINVSLSYQLYDMMGKLLENKKLTGNETIILMANYIPAIYLLKIYDSQKEIKTFKIIKNK